MITMQNYKDELTELCILEVSGEGCANCLSLMPILNEIVSKRNDIKLKHLEADIETAELLKLFEVDRVPTILLIDKGEVFARAVGYQPEEILELWIDAKIEEHINK